MSIIGFDIDNKKILQYQPGIDPTQKAGNESIANSNIEFTSDETKLKEAGVFIITVPTPINQDETPNLQAHY